MNKKKKKKKDKKKNDCSNKLTKNNFKTFNESLKNENELWINWRKKNKFYAESIKRNTLFINKNHLLIKQDDLLYK